MITMSRGFTQIRADSRRFFFPMQNQQIASLVAYQF